MAFAPVFQRPFAGTFDRHVVGAPPAANWWEAGGAPTPVAVYQPKGAASLAASYVNLANPGTYDAAPGTAPSWSSAGWAFNGIDQYLTTGITPDGSQTWSMLIACSSGHVAAGLVDGYKKFMLWTRTDYGGQRIASSGNGSYGWIGGLPSTPFVFGFAGLSAYYNGAYDGAIDDEADTTYSQAVTIGLVNTVGWRAAGTITAFVIWDTSTGHATWMPAVSAAVALI